MNKNRIMLPVLLLLIAALACNAPGLSGNQPTFTSPPTRSFQTTTPLTATITLQPMCTPPLCAEGEVFSCPGECPGGCGTTCATVTPPATTETLAPMCTPPACAENESYYCPGECPGGCGTVCATHTPPAVSWWQPTPGTTFHIQYEGEVDLTLPVDAYNLDLFETSNETIQTLHGRGVQVICYFSAGTWEEWRPDAGDFPQKVIGNPLEDWPGEYWLDIGDLTVIKPIMSERLDLAQAKGCDAVDPDNVNGYTNNTGFPLSETDQLAYNLWLASAAHARGLSIGLKNDLEQIPSLVNAFDFAVNEACYTFDECDRLLPFIQQNKAVFGIEYQADPAAFCPQAREDGFSFVLKNEALNAFAAPCW